MFKNFQLNFTLFQKNKINIFPTIFCGSFRTIEKNSREKRKTQIGIFFKTLDVDMTGVLNDIQSKFLAATTFLLRGLATVDEKLSLLTLNRLRERRAI